MPRLITLALVALLAGLAACRKPSSDLVVGTGTVYAVGGECTGVWLLRSDEGRQYELADLPAEYREPELRVRYRLKPKPDYVSGCMIGQGMHVISITRLCAGAGPAPPPERVSRSAIRPPRGRRSRAPSRRRAAGTR